MLLSGRSPLHHVVWTQSRPESLAMTTVQEAAWEEQDDQMEVEVDYPVSSPAVVGESFCQCELQETGSRGAVGLGPDPPEDCLCGEEDQGFDWVWDESCKSSESFLSCDNRKVNFHSEYSCGTAAIRGTKELADGQHFWEIKMTSPVYGTDMMVGIGTSEVNLDKFKYSFCSLLGHDQDSWGLSYTGVLHHKGDKVKFSSRFGQGSIIGMHLDTWHGMLTVYKNRCCIGVAATRLQNKTFYPMVCSTAAKSSMKVIRACSTPTSLQYLCCSRLRREMPDCPDVLKALDLPPGLSSLLHARLGWVFTLQNNTPEEPPQPRDLPDEYGLEMSPPASPAPSPCPSPTPCSSPSPCPSPTLSPCLSTTSLPYLSPCPSPTPSPPPCLSPCPSPDLSPIPSPSTIPSQSTIPSPCPSPVSTLSACISLSPCISPVQDPLIVQCPCRLHPLQVGDRICICPPTPPSSDYDSCCSEPDNYQSKRCRWT